MDEAGRKEDWERDGVWFLYDGACPMCSSVVHALRLKTHYGEIHLLDARTSTSDPLYREVTARGLDLDEGMAIAADGQIHHGADAVTFMARFGDPKSPFTALVKSIFWSDTLARWAYPWMRATRNVLLRRREIGQIDNLALEARKPLDPPPPNR